MEKKKVFHSKPNPAVLSIYSKCTNFNQDSALSIPAFKEK